MTSLTQETVVGADITGDAAMLASVINGADLHCAFARVLYPEIADLSDEEIKQNHKDKRNASKSPRFCFQFGGTGYTLAMNMGIPVAKGMEIEAAFKELHEGLYTYGEEKLEEAIKLGYIESTMGFKLQLPNFEEFKTFHQKLQIFTKSDWKLYKEGKGEYKAHMAANDKNEPYTIQNHGAYIFYKNNKNLVSKYFRLKSKYMRLCLNAPTQTTAAHMTKLAACELFEYIESRGHLDLVKIPNIIHDEFNLEVIEELGEEYKEKLGYFMRKAGNKLLTSGLVEIQADGNIGKNWYESK